MEMDHEFTVVQLTNIHDQVLQRGKLKYEEILKNEITALKSEITSLDVKITTLEAKIPALKSEIAALEAKIITLKSEITSLEGKVEKVEKVEELEEKKKELNKQIKEKQENEENIQRIKNQILKVLENIEKNEAQIIQIESEKSLLQKKINFLDSLTEKNCLETIKNLILSMEGLSLSEKEGFGEFLIKLKGSQITESDIKENNIYQTQENIIPDKLRHKRPNLTEVQNTMLTNSETVARENLTELERFVYISGYHSDLETNSSEFMFDSGIYSMILDFPTLKFREQEKEKKIIRNRNQQFINPGVFKIDKEEYRKYRPHPDFACYVSEGNGKKQIQFPFIISEHKDGSKKEDFVKMCIMAKISLLIQKKVYENDKKKFLLGITISGFRIKFYFFTLKDKKTIYKLIEEVDLNKTEGKQRASEIMFNFIDWFQEQNHEKMKEDGKQEIIQLIEKNENFKSLHSKSQSENKDTSKKKETKEKNNKMNDVQEQLKTKLAFIFKQNGYRVELKKRLLTLSTIGTRDESSSESESESESERERKRERDLVYFGFHENGYSRTSVVIKVIDEESNEEKIMKFLNTTENIANEDNLSVRLIKHQVLKLKEEKKSCLVMERFNNDDIENFEDFQIVCLQLARFTSFLHSNKISHCDFKPDNILFDNDKKQIRVIDFGLSEFFQPDQLFENFKGTEGFIPPEIEEDKPHRKDQADIYSLGKTLEHYFDRLLSIQKKSEIANIYQDIIEKMCHPNPCLRPSSIELYDRFLALLNPSSQQQTTTTTTTR